MEKHLLSVLNHTWCCCIAVSLHKYSDNRTKIEFKQSVSTCRHKPQTEPEKDHSRRSGDVCFPLADVCFRRDGWKGESASVCALYSQHTLGCLQSLMETKDLFVSSSENYCPLTFWAKPIFNSLLFYTSKRWQSCEIPPSAASSDLRAQRVDKNPGRGEASHFEHGFKPSVGAVTPSLWPCWIVKKSTFFEERGRWKSVFYAEILNFAWKFIDIQSFSSLWEQVLGSLQQVFASLCTGIR